MITQHGQRHSPRQPSWGGRLVGGSEPRTTPVRLPEFQLADLEGAGYKKVIVKSDQEAVMRALRAKEDSELTFLIRLREWQVYFELFQK